MHVFVLTSSKRSNGHARDFSIHALFFFFLFDTLDYVREKRNKKSCVWSVNHAFDIIEYLLRWRVHKIKCLFFKPWYIEPNSCYEWLLPCPSPAYRIMYIHSFL